MGLLARPLPLFAVSALIAAALSALALVLVTAFDSDPADTPVSSRAVTTPTTASTTPSATATATPRPQLAGSELADIQITPAELPPGDYARYSGQLSYAIDDVGAYWESWFAERGVAWQPPTMYSRAEFVPELLCDGQSPNVDGSYYCTPDNFIALAEAGQTLPIYVHVGFYGLATVVSHEFGHAVQRALDLDHERSSSKELQADCFAGAWFRSYRDKGAFVDRQVPFSQAIGAMGTTDQGEDLSERSESFSAGFDGGPDACLAGFPEDGLRTIAR